MEALALTVKRYGHCVFVMLSYHVAKSRLCSHNLSFCMPEAMAGKGLQDCGLIGRLGGWTSGILENTVMVCNGTVWRRTVPVFIQESEGRNVYVTNPCK